MTTQLQPFVIETDRGLLTALVAAPLPIERVQTVPHADGWQVAVVRMDGEQVLPAVYAVMYDAERAAAGIAVQYDLSLMLDDDPFGDTAHGLLEGAYMDRTLAELDAGEREPLVRMTADDWREVEDEEIGADFCSRPFLY